MRPRRLTFSQVIRGNGMAGVVALALALAACGSSAGGGSASGGVLIDELIPLTGPSADIGPSDDIPGFKAGALAVNGSGGVLGHPITLTETDLGADPADSITNTRQMLAQHPNVAGVVGLTSDTAVVTAQLLNSAHMVAITQAGTNQLDHVRLPYLWRDFQPDTVNSVAMAAYALSHGYRRAALMIGQNSGSQSVVPTLVKSFTGHGGHVVINEQLPLDQSSYQAELTKMLSSHPDVIFTETDPQSAATMFSELKGMNGLSIPVIGTSATAIGPYWNTVSKAVGGVSAMNKFFTDITPPSTGSGPGYNTFLKFYKRANPGVATNVYVAGNYDCIVIMALAMDMAGSTKPSDYVKDIPKVVDDHSASAVTTYAAGLAAIKAHKAFYYAGALGPVSFNPYHSITGLSVAQKSSGSGNSFVTVQKLSNDLVAKYQ